MEGGTTWKRSATPSSNRLAVPCMKTHGTAFTEKIELSPKDNYIILNTENL